MGLTVSGTGETGVKETHNLPTSPFHLDRQASRRRTRGRGVVRRGQSCGCAAWEASVGKSPEQRPEGGGERAGRPGERAHLAAPDGSTTCAKALGQPCAWRVGGAAGRMSEGLGQEVRTRGAEGAEQGRIPLSAHKRPLAVSGRTRRGQHWDPGRRD